MKPVTLKLDRQDEKMRAILERWYAEKHGRNIPSAEILRDLMREKCNLISKQP